MSSHFVPGQFFFLNKARVTEKLRNPQCYYDRRVEVGEGEKLVTDENKLWSAMVSHLLKRYLKIRPNLIIKDIIKSLSKDNSESWCKNCYEFDPHWMSFKHSFVTY